ncbi:hypothetical protein [Enterovirga rhinocerotis]|uniref:Uncharacterized protein n=1 Tax=Enterovirga rhinocerotis TaxID=1339210 RepID=A0A4R7C5A9_9HYPH|nr:hypothetical protein [Enterovirga rhinocerotis]TDR93750.1 hypothetical protein EV668_1015 [Enterovirga rhinocerotis]
MPPAPERPPKTFIEEWREGDRNQRLIAVLKRFVPLSLFIVFMYFFTTFAGQ